MRIWLAIAITISISACESAKDVTSEHPFRESLVGTHLTEKQLYLYGSDDSGYSIHNSEIVTYTYSDGIEARNQYPADVILPPGATITISRIEFSSAKTGGPHTRLVGYAEDSGSGETFPIRTIHEFLGVDLVAWQKAHPGRMLPSTTEYLERATGDKLPWQSDGPNAP